MSTVGQLTNLDEMRIVLCGCTLLLKCNEHFIYIHKLRMNHQFPVYVGFYYRFFCYQFIYDVHMAGKK